MYKIIDYKKIEKYLKENKLTQKEFCKICKISLSSLRKMKYGANDFYIETIFRVCKVIKCNLFEIFNEEEREKWQAFVVLNKLKNKEQTI